MFPFPRDALFDFFFFVVVARCDTCLTFLYALYTPRDAVFL